MQEDKRASDNPDSKDRLNRRELLAKYGPYTAPIVVSMLVPSEAYSHANGQVYSTVAACGADTGASVMGAMHGPTTNHCNRDGAGMSHPISSI